MISFSFKGGSPSSLPRLHCAICHAKVGRHRLLRAALDLEAVGPGKQADFNNTDDLDELFGEAINGPDAVLTVLALEVLGQGKRREGRIDERVAVVGHYRASLARQPGAEHRVDCAQLLEL